MQPDLIPLLDILQRAQWIREFIRNVDRDAFLNDIMRREAVIRQLEVIGEAVRRVSEEFRMAHPDIPWQDIAGMRSKLIHGYDRINLQVVWDTAVNDIPALIEQIAPLVPPDEDDDKAADSPAV
jgi:uncharacterized protein with HEPN domain